MTPTEIITFAEATFPKSVPRMTLRQGNTVDSYRSPNLPTEEEARVPEDRYLEEFHWGIAHLDRISWKHYLPYLISYSIRHMGDGGSLVVSGLLQSLRPPDREPPRLATITKEEERVIVSFLELLGFDKASIRKRRCRYYRNIGHLEPPTENEEAQRRTKRHRQLRGCALPCLTFNVGQKMKAIVISQSLPLGACSVRTDTDVLAVFRVPAGASIDLGDILELDLLVLDRVQEITNSTKGQQLSVELRSHDVHDLRLPSGHGTSRFPSTERRE